MRVDRNPSPALDPDTSARANESANANLNRSGRVNVNVNVTASSAASTNSTPTPISSPSPVLHPSTAETSPAHSVSGASRPGSKDGCADASRQSVDRCQPLVVNGSGVGRDAVGVVA